MIDDRIAFTINTKLVVSTLFIISRDILFIDCDADTSPLSISLTR